MESDSRGGGGSRVNESATVQWHLLGRLPMIAAFVEQLWNPSYLSCNVSQENLFMLYVVYNTACALDGTRIRTDQTKRSTLV